MPKVDKERELGGPPITFLTYLFILLASECFSPFQHWLTAKSAKAFRQSVAHPLCIMIVSLRIDRRGFWDTPLTSPSRSSNMLAT